jgi:hypothetical protein
MGEATLESWGKMAEEAGKWFANYTLLVVIISSVLLAIIIYIPNRNSDSAQTYGRIAKVVTSAASAITALTLLLPFVARALWGSANAGQPILPQCFSAVASPCDEHLKGNRSLPPPVPGSAAILAASLAGGTPAFPEGSERLL